MIIFFVSDIYRLTDEVLGEGACASVKTCVQISTEVEYAVKVNIFFSFANKLFQVF